MAMNDPVINFLALPRRGEAFDDIMYGVELEYEQCHGLAPAPPALWNVTRDGSLRNNGLEFVSQVLRPDQLDRALDRMNTFLEGTDAEAHPRCGTHVHLNMRPCTIGNLYSLIVLHTLLEFSMFERFAPDRVTSAFCVPLSMNYQFQQAAFRANEMVRRDNEVWPLELCRGHKYSAVNCGPLTRFGSLEFRYLNSTRDFAFLRTWIDALTAMWNVARLYNEPGDVIDWYEEDGLGSLQQEIIGEEIALPPNARQRRAEQAATIIAGQL